MQRFIIVDELFTRYTIYVDIIDRKTEVYCDECDEWIVEYDGEQISRHTHLDLFEKIVRAHDEHTHGILIEFEDWREKFK